MLTSAKITLDNSRAQLQKDDIIITAEIIQPAQAIFDTASTRPTYHPDERLNTGTRLLTVSVPLKIDKINTVVIVLKPKGITLSPQTDKIKITPLSKWKGYFGSVGE